ncbi:carotenoid oxygenase family protein [Marinicella meishanensis]|uniref:carotenoid oxygenase family protein n=1 Tax=Marinicella meishanensis TaxID=2873263 RepID=UPI001CBC0752|nr:carotenoid oxygenase family protein [Marinicella sp. NBU2979]
MKRREFVTQLSLLGALGLAPKMLLAADQLVAGNLSTLQRFNQALPKQPKLVGYANYTQERVVDRLTIEGQFPKQLRGQLFRNGPALFERGGLRYGHLFEGDGMIHAFDFKDGQVSYQNKFVRTDKFVAEQAADRFLYDFSGLGIEQPSPITSADSINPANTNVLPIGDDIWALWEAGSAHKLDPNTLQTKGKVTLDPGLKGMPFSAHPKVDIDGTIWNFGLDYGSGKIILYRLKPNGQLDRFGLIDSQYHAMLHDFLVTEKHILVILPSLTIKPDAPSFMQRQTFANDQPMRVLVVDKNDLTVRSTHEFPPCFLFHFGNAWEDRDGTIHFDGCRYRNLDIMQVIEQVMVGQTVPNQHAFSQTVKFTIRPNGHTDQQVFAGISEFPRIYPSQTGIMNQKVFTIGGQPEGGWMQSVRSLNVHTGQEDAYDYGDDYLVEEHIVVERDGQPGKSGWLLGTALHWPSKKTCVNVFEAENISAGPLAKAWLPFHIPLGFHGNFRSLA